MIRALPRRMRDELHDEVCAPVIESHPFFLCFAKNRKACRHLLYENALMEVSVRFGKELFVAEEVATSMYFVISGQLIYQDEKGFHAVRRDRIHPRTTPALYKDTS